MDTLFIFAFIALLLCQDFVSGSCPNENPKPNSATLTHFHGLDKVIIAYMKKHEVCGASVSVSRYGRLLYAQGYGKATETAKATPLTRFRIASLSKPVTATAVMKQIEECRKKKSCTSPAVNSKVYGKKGLLQQFTPSGRYLDKVQVKHLLQHTGGWNHDQDTGIGDPTAYLPRSKGKTATKKYIINSQMDDDLEYYPGTTYSYSNLGYLTLGRVVEDASGQSYEATVKRMLKDIGIWRMQIGKTKLSQRAPYEAQYFCGTTCSNPVVKSPKFISYPDAEYVPAPYGRLWIENRDSHGGWIASSIDIVRFLNAMDGRGGYREISQSTLDEMTSRPSYDKSGGYYGYGLAVYDHGSQGKDWWHCGGQPGVRSVMYRSHYNGISFSVLMNTNTPRFTCDDLYNTVREELYSIKKWPTHNLFYLDAAKAVSKDKKHIVIYGIPSSDMQAIFNTMTRTGYRMTWRDGQNVGSKTFFNVIFIKKDGKKWRSYSGLSGSSYQSKFDMAVSDGYRLVNVDSYLQSGKLRYTAIFVKQSGPSWRAYHGLSTTSHQQKFDQFKKQGYRIVQRSITEYKGKLYVTALYDKSNAGSWSSKSGLSSSAYNTYFKQQTEKGRKLAHLQAYTHKGNARFAAIFTSKGPSSFRARHGMSAGSLQSKLDSWTPDGYNVQFITGYAHGSSPRYAAMWSH